MNKAICSLNFVYSMERFATAIYRVQRGGFKQKVVSERMDYAVDNERQHAESLKKRLIDTHHTPFPLAFLFQFAGIMLGGITKCFGKTLALKTDVAIEKRAVKDYSYFLRTSKYDSETQELIKNIIADEERHIRNWQDSIKVVKGKT